MAYNRGTRHKPKWTGHAECKGHKKWVGTFDSKEEYSEAKARCLAELREEVENPGKQKVSPPKLLLDPGRSKVDEGHSALLADRRSRGRSTLVEVSDIGYLSAPYR
jgi:hypothetical protein